MYFLSVPNRVKNVAKSTTVVSAYINKLINVSTTDTFMYSILVKRTPVSMRIPAVLTTSTAVNCVK